MNESSQILQVDIQNFEEEFSVRLTNLFRTLKISTVGDLVSKTTADLMQCGFFGKKSLVEVRRFLSKRNLSLKDDILISEDEHKKFVLGIPETISELKTQVNEIHKIIKKLEWDLDRIQIFIQEKYDTD